MQKRSTCQGCRDGASLPFQFTMAFQPIVDLRPSPCGATRPWSEAPGVKAQAKSWRRSRTRTATASTRSAASKRSRPPGACSGDRNLRLSINFMPNAVYEPAACIRTSLYAAARVGLPRNRIMFEFTEDEKIADVAKLANIVNEYRRFGFVTALDDFGSGYAGLSLLAAFQPDLIKIDMGLIRSIDTDRRRQTIVAGIVAMARTRHRGDRRRCGDGCRDHGSSRRGHRFVPGLSPRETTARAVSRRSRHRKL